MKQQPSGEHPTLSFGLTASLLLEELKSDTEKLKKDVLNVTLARYCAIRAWHLHDYVFETLDQGSEFSTKKELREHIDRACPELYYLRVICNASKHSKLDYKPRITTARIHQGDFDPNDFGDDFDIPCLVIELLDGKELMFYDTLRRAVDFWSEFFENHGIA